MDENRNVSDQNWKDAIVRVVKVAAPTAAASAFYALALGAIAATFATGDLPTVLFQITTAVGFNNLSTVLARLAQREQVDDEEIKCAVESAIADSKISELLTQDAFQREMARLALWQISLIDLIKQGDAGIIAAIEEQLRQSKGLRDELAQQRATLEEIIRIIGEMATRKQVNEVLRRLDRLCERLLGEMTRRYLCDFHATIAEKTRWFVGRQHVFERLEAFMRAHQYGYFRIIADAGLGKTALAATLTQRYGGIAFFFSASEGVTRPDMCLNHLSAELIVRYALDQDTFPPRANEGNSRFFQECLGQAAERAVASGQRIVLILDALDEAEAPPAGANWLYLPRHLPAGVYVVTTQRPGDYLLTTDPAIPLDELTIHWDDPWQQDDIRAHLHKQAQRPEMQDVLRRAHPPIAPQRFVEALAEASAGNFMYLEYVLQDILERAEGFDPLQLTQLPRGLEGYYAQFWARMESVRDQEGWAEWQNLYRPVIALLGAAAEPVTAQWLAQLCGRAPDEVQERALRRWARFLSPRGRDGKQTWRIVHRSFADFLAQKVDLAEAHRRIAAHYRAEAARWQADDGYALRHLSAHLAAAGDAAGLFALVEDAAWYAASCAYDLSRRSYAHDLERAIALAEGQGLDGLPRLAAYRLLHASLGELAGRVPLAALEVMVQLGEVQRAEGYAALIPDRAGQAHAWVWIAHALIRAGDVTRARAVLERALGVAEGITDRGDKARVLAEVAGALVAAGDAARARTVLERALDVAKGIAVEWLKAQVLAEVARALVAAGDAARARAVLERALGVAAGIADRVDKARVLAEVARALVAAGDVERALDVAEGIAVEWWKAQVLAEVARALVAAGDAARARAVLERVLGVAAGIAVEWLKAQVLAEVARALVAAGDAARARAVLERALGVAAGIADRVDKARVLVAVARALVAAGDVERALDVAEGIAVEWWKAQALVKVAGALAAAGDAARARAVLERALGVAAGIADGVDKARVLVEVARALVAAGDAARARAVRERALGVAAGIAVEWLKAQVLAEVARALVAAGDAARARAVRERALGVAAGIADRVDKARVLAEVARALVAAGDAARARAVLERALGVAAGIADRVDKARVLAEVARALVAAGDVERALDVAEGIAVEWWKAQALVKVAGALAAAGDAARARAVLERALGVAEGIVDGEEKAQALVEVARALVAAGDVERALDVAEGIAVEWWKAQALVKVARALVAAGDVERALDVAAGIAVEWWKAQALVKVAGALAAAGDAARARAVRERALGVAAGTAVEWLKAQVLVEVARALAAAGDAARARAVLERALGVAEGIRDREDKARVLVEVAGALVAVGDVERALEVAEEIADKEWKTHALVEVAEGLARAGGAPAEALPFCQRVLRVAAALGRAATWQCIGALVPLFARIGRAVLWETCERLERVEQLLRGAQPGTEAP
jgi:tetratricopeptide (TPR) repeat protein